MTAAPWTITSGDDPVVATAIHAGHDLRPEVASLMVLPESDRLREEDPFTDRWVGIAANRVVANRSRFEVDLNRPPERAVYRSPDEAWGLEVWSGEPPADVVARSLDLHRSFYDAMTERCDDLIEAYGRVVVLDLHSYNHRRSGPTVPPADPAANPELNIGTASLHRRGWESVVDAFAETLASLPFGESRLDVRFDVNFGGGHMVRWLNHHYGERCCALAIEVKKIYMDEWTGEPDEDVIAAVGRLLGPAAEAARSAMAIGGWG